MEEHHPFSYALLDSKRLKEAFFSPPKKKKRKKIPLKNKIIYIGISLLMLLFFIGFIFSNYEIVFTKKIKLPKNLVSILDKKNLYSLQLLEEKEISTLKASSVKIPLSFKKNTLLISFKNPIDLSSNKLLFYFRKPPFPLKMDLVMRDTNYYSNSLNPIEIKIDKDKNSYLEVPIELSQVNLQNTNISEVMHLRLHFYPLNLEEKNWILIKDILLIKKGEE